MFVFLSFLFLFFSKGRGHSRPFLIVFCCIFPQAERTFPRNLPVTLEITGKCGIFSVFIKKGGMVLMLRPSFLLLYFLFCFILVGSERLLRGL